MELTNECDKLSNQDELQLLKRAYMINKCPSGLEIRHLALIMGRSHATVRTWFEAHKPVDTHDSVNRELQNALERFDYLDSSEQEDQAEDEESDLTESEEELVTPKNDPLSLQKSKTSNTSKTFYHDRQNHVSASHGSSTMPSTPAMGARSQESSSPTPRPGRTSSSRSLINGEKKAALESHFRKDPNPTMESRKKLALKIHIDPHRISQWFAMRRFRLRRASEESSKSNEYLDEKIISCVDVKPEEVPRPTPTLHRKPDPPAVTRAPINMSLRSKTRREPFSSSSTEPPPPKRIRFIAPASVKSRSSRARHAPRNFFPQPDWNAPPSSNKIPHFTFWFAKDRQASFLPTVADENLVACPDAQSTVSTLSPFVDQSRVSHMSKASSDLCANPKPRNPEFVAKPAANQSSSSKPGILRTTDFLPSITIQTETQSSISQVFQTNSASTLLPRSTSHALSVTSPQNIPGTKPVSRSIHSSISQDPFAENPPSLPMIGTMQGVSHPGSLIAYPASTISKADPRYGFHPPENQSSVHAHHNPTRHHHHYHVLPPRCAGTPTIPHSIGRWSYPMHLASSHTLFASASGSIPTNPHLAPPSKATVYSSHALDANVVTSTMSKLDTIATIAQMQAQAQE
ncbi:hypothetical protein DACRYDRAFT_107571 [Dacryopinax primogenitus]|uniref:Homeobox domain-containing protein n=1 Tax=Dacryopinax primogenitus (strain DJM 731) TaxID=1858805 RepID=M5FVJ3_DACPD|nr:uncharacterized protein DACRYDRAFT_107571 [Dacryopinax primogenitus]EJU01836.1 hypothetical protein DACRYDRAFT_107571 [Dacryopinax primogenitus]